MIAYGLPRNIGIKWPDLADIALYGLKSSASRLPSKCGDRKNSFRNPFVKSAARRVWKKRERTIARRLIYLEI